MRAAVLTRFGAPLSVRRVARPEAGGGETVVEVLATCVAPYAAEVFSGERNYPLVPPVVPGVGGVGRIVRVGPDATRLRPGDLVWCDSTVRSRDDALAPDIALQGWSSRGEGGARLARNWPDGSFAEFMRIPTENAYPLPAAAADDPARWAALGVHCIPYGGLLAGGLAAGETLLVSGATGNLGSSAVAVAVAMGAGRVVAPGRNRAALDLLADRFGSLLRPVLLTGDEAADRAAMSAAADGPVDMVIDLLPPSAPGSVSRTAAMTVRANGRVVLMGGVGMLGGEDIALPYRWIMRNSVTVRGQWMYPRTANVGMVRLLASGALDLAPERVRTFGLDAVNDAVAHAAAHGGPFDRTVLVPPAG
ncbi:alcohol dehydrogenase catalytic domain-containing protein [Streptomyces olivaceus]|uniref:Zinc-binding dehydrogenase n=1 Tax=Streptomyces olivaceus TaxID=47716 RepID=A0ABS7W2A0_STROV|nr:MULTISPECIES: zinc-binding dehydrogenase [Streptomyces]MBZ6088471.1 zinc-binding dehydrogenase [Streptomyces olivaceus]MBZ6094692.1 zinc-binding dehydrogenase [Streptomyces olivaceus]MBZ6116611.1 zinc-binding dehydrogenase [Streptomyces olivaceus]MBZ6151316.1 zinc-binding dehydrogenase [Streptomyces olivaceus]MBZ6191311.1 zinc-binding dehydrogenase [Streptomyces olivaceus]